MFDIPLLINLFIPLIELKNIHQKHQIKEKMSKIYTGVNLKQIKQPNQSCSLEQRMTLAKISLSES